MTKELLAGRLMLMGLIPFWVLALAGILSPTAFGFDLRLPLLSYGAVIVSFIAGIHWGLYLQQDAPMNLFIHSNIIAVVAWVAVILSSSISYLILVGCFVYLLVIDRRLYQASLIDPWFMRKRIEITALVITALVLTFTFGR